MSEPRWLTPEIVRALHLLTVSHHGGSDAIRDQGLLGSALQRAPNLHAYGERPSIFELAAAYCFGIVRNHPLVDGNKRTGLLAGHAFLSLNGYDFVPDEAEVVAMIMALASGELEETALAQWFAEGSRPRRGDTKER